MNVIRSKTIGYCHGVSQTIDKALYCLKLGEERKLPVYSIGTLIHNPDVVQEFERSGCKVIKSETEVEPGIALIRAHGIPDEKRKAFVSKGFELIDATCDNILFTKNVIRKASNEGRTVVILGIADHAEAQCLVGTEGVNAFLVSSDNDLGKIYSSISEETPVTVVTQTTFPEPLFNDILEKLKSHFENLVVGNNLCPACIARKKHAQEIAEQCDVVVVVGGKESENTKNLADYIAQFGKPVFSVENENAFDTALDSRLKRYRIVGVCSGTSTPTEVIERVCKHLVTLETD